jgi:hypothetical protein
VQAKRNLQPRPNRMQWPQPPVYPSRTLQCHKRRTGSLFSGDPEMSARRRANRSRITSSRVSSGPDCSRKNDNLTVHRDCCSCTGRDMDSQSLQPRCSTSQLTSFPAHGLGMVQGSECQLHTLLISPSKLSTRLRSSTQH